MCGVFQVIQRHQPIDRRLFQSALASMEHRGPDQHDTYFEEAIDQAGQAVFLGFGHQRLSILDLSEKSKQPYHFGQNTLIFNGEIYNFQELNEQVVAHGMVVRTSSDTDTVFNLLSLNQEACLPKFNGMWGLSMWFAKEQYCLLSRDRYGKKPLFYYQNNDLLCVSSTLRAIQIYLGKPLQFSRHYLSNYFVFQEAFPSADATTHFSDIRQIVPGHSARFCINDWTMKQRPYFDFYARALPPEALSHDYLVDIFTDSLKKRLISDRPIALLLSGGIDSSLILSALVSLGLAEQCQVYMGETGKSDDYAYAKACAEQVGIKAISVALDYDNNTFERFIQVCRHHERPFSLNGSSMAMPQMYEVIAADGIPVVLDGTGGDEIFGGYRQRQLPFAQREAAKANLIRQLKLPPTQLIKSSLPELAVGWEQLFDRLKALANPMLMLSAQDVFSAQASDPLGNPRLGFEQALCADTAPGGRLHEWLWHNDRNSMMHSIEARSPLLDFRLNAFIHSAVDQKITPEWNKLELRKLFDAFTPLPTQWRKQKQGFRWDGGKFIAQNHQQIIELIAAHKTLHTMGIVNTPRLAAALKKQPKLLKSTFVKKVMSVAAVEEGLR